METKLAHKNQKETVENWGTQNDEGKIGEWKSLRIYEKQ